MKVLFSNPPWWDAMEGSHVRAGVRAGSRWPFTMPVRSTPDSFVYGDYLPYPFFLGYATNYARANTDAAVAMRDSIALRESYVSYFNYLASERFDYVFIETATPSWEHDKSVIQRILQVSPATKVVVCGPITTIKAKQILAELPVHACVKGEYEKGSVRVINGASGVIDYDLLSVKEMNDAPPPYLDRTIALRYCDANPVGQVFPHAQVWSSRGCPYKCIFCVWPATMTGNDPDGTGRRSVRHYSPDYTDRYLRGIVAEYGYRSIYFDDDTFNLGNKHVLELCRVMKGIGLPWSAMCRADTVKMETWQVMRESGCFGVKLGFESGNQYVVDKIVNKHLDLNYATDVVYELKRLGMTAHGTFTVGLPGESKEQMQDTMRFIESLPLTSYQLSGTAEIEGTPLHTLRQSGKLENYEGAVMDSAAEMHTDGAKRLSLLALELRNS